MGVAPWAATWFGVRPTFDTRPLLVGELTDLIIGLVDRLFPSPLVLVVQAVAVQAPGLTDRTAALLCTGVVPASLIFKERVPKFILMFSETDVF